MMHETETAEILSSTHDGKGIASTEGKRSLFEERSLEKQLNL